jgi:hypothetical protein
MQARVLLRADPDENVLVLKKRKRHLGTRQLQDTTAGREPTYLRESAVASSSHVG